MGQTVRFASFTMFSPRGDEENILEPSRPFSLGQNPQEHCSHACQEKESLRHKRTFSSRIEIGKQCTASSSMLLDRKSSILVWPNFRLLQSQSISEKQSIPRRMTISFRHKSPSSPRLNLALSPTQETDKPFAAIDEGVCDATSLIWQVIPSSTRRTST